jgi:putative FmdB family regulatory protein
VPTYDFLCQKCTKVFELICSIIEYEHKEKQGVKCPECGSSKIVRQISGFQVKTSRKS